MSPTIVSTPNASAPTPAAGLLLMCVEPLSAPAGALVRIPLDSTKALSEFQGPLPDRDVRRARRGERLAVPVAPSLAQPHACEPRHQVELARCRGAERDREPF